MKGKKSKEWGGTEEVGAGEELRDRRGYMTTLYLHTHTTDTQTRLLVE